jgi:hypothetical protein
VGYRFIRQKAQCVLNGAGNDDIQPNMKRLGTILPLLGGAALISGCASDFQSTGSGSSAAYDYSVTANDPTSSSPAPDTTAQDAIDRVNQQMAIDAANAAAQQQFLAGMAAAQETMNNANNNQATSNW